MKSMYTLLLPLTIDYNDINIEILVILQILYMRSMHIPIQNIKTYI